VLTLVYKGFGEMTMYLCLGKRALCLCLGKRALYQGVCDYVIVR